jgi:hypothetical protein
MIDLKPNEKMLEQIYVDLYNKKVLFYGDLGTKIVFRCGSVSELVEFVEQSEILLKTDNVIVS